LAWLFINDTPGSIQTMKSWLILTAIITVLISCHSHQISSLEMDPISYFEETGHSVKGDFLHFYEIYGGLESLGYPLTEEILVDGWTVQYFEKGRLERHPENEPAYRITVGWLGDLLHRRRPPIPNAYIPRADLPNLRYFPQTGHTLSGDFLHYFDVHGGSVRFGMPISEPFLWEGHLTQDFQSARFYWSPQRKPPVTLEDIGLTHFEIIGLDSTLLDAIDD
jgi:hypothetical protein